MTAPTLFSRSPVSRRRSALFVKNHHALELALLPPESIVQLEMLRLFRREACDHVERALRRDDIIATGSCADRNQNRFFVWPGCECGKPRAIYAVPCLSDIVLDLCGCRQPVRCRSPFRWGRVAGACRERDQTEENRRIPGHCDSLHVRLHAHQPQARQ